MYEEFFRSSVRPFRATPDTRFYFPYESIETARQTVLRATLRAEGPVMVLGGAGLGKSLLGEMVASDLAGKFDVVKLQAARLCSRRALLQNILFELRMPYRNLSEGELRLSILDRLEPSEDRAPEGVLIIVDEAHTLPEKLLDELRLLTNFTRNDQPRTRIVLIGSMRLEDTFASPLMESFNQRLAARCYLMPMNREQTHQYVQHQIKAAGYKPSEFLTSDGLDAVYAACEGVPRLANQIMDHALVLAITNHQCPVSAPLVEEAWADLQQLPSPWHSAADRYAESVASVVEFGSMEDKEPESSLFASDTPTDNISAEAPADEVALEPNWDGDSSPEEEFQLSTSGDGEDLPNFTENFSENFFAAFEGLPDVDSEPTADACEAETECGEPSAEQDVSELTRPTIEFAAKHLFQEGRHAVGHDPATIPILPTDSFFMARPTDERMLALEDEQAQYDAMGIWENDPPISPTMSLVCSPSDEAIDETNALDELLLETNDEAAAAATHLSTSSIDLFGDDFEEEVHITESRPLVDSAKLIDCEASIVPQETTPACEESTTLLADRPIPTDEEMQAFLVADHLHRIQEFTDNIEAQVASAQTPSARVEDVLAGLQTHAEYATADARLISVALPWSVDVAAAALDKESQVQHEIEDIVSQLNFSAFSVEPFSIEQINIDAAPNHSNIPEDSVRSGDANEIYMMHRAQETNDNDFFNEESMQYEDDRDMLTIEEDLPLNTKSGDAVDARPPVRTAPYSQLFAKLRK